jgi:hypothetical protein
VPSDKSTDVLTYRLTVAGIIEPKIHDSVSSGFEGFSKRTHRRKEGDNLLNVMVGIVGLLPHFHHNERSAFIRAQEP